MGDVEIECENQNQLTLKRFSDGVTEESVNWFCLMKNIRAYCRMRLKTNLLRVTTAFNIQTQISMVNASFRTAQNHKCLYKNI